MHRFETAAAACRGALYLRATAHSSHQTLLVEMLRRPQRAGIQEHHVLITGSAGLCCAVCVFIRTGTRPVVAGRQSPLAEGKDQSTDGGGSLMVKIVDVAEARFSGTSVYVCVCVLQRVHVSVNEGQMVTFYEKTLDPFQAATWLTCPNWLNPGGRTLQVDRLCPGGCCCHD